MTGPLVLNYMFGRFLGHQMMKSTRTPKGNPEMLFDIIRIVKWVLIEYCNKLRINKLGLCKLPFKRSKFWPFLVSDHLSTRLLTDLIGVLENL